MCDFQTTEQSVAMRHIIDISFTRWNSLPDSFVKMDDFPQCLETRIIF